MKKILITSGGTREYIDSVRVLTNISTGKLGAKIANKFLSENASDKFIFVDKEGFFLNRKQDIKYKVYYVAPKSAKQPELMEFVKDNEFSYIEITDVNSVCKVMEELVPEMDVVIHLMAVSDFGFKPASTKLKSSDPIAFIESLKDRVYQTPKILPLIKKWNPLCKLVSFKFEVGLEHEDLVSIARKSMKGGSSDLVIANDKVEMVENNSHIAYAITEDNETKLNSKDEIVEYLYLNLI